MTDLEPGVEIVAVAAQDAAARRLLEDLTAELAGAGYTAEQTFGYSTEQLERADVHLVGASVAAAW